VSKIEKLKTKAKNTPASIRFSDVEKLILGMGFELANVKGSHYVYKKGSKLITLVKPHGGHKYCAIVDVNKVLELLEKEQIT